MKGHREGNRWVGPPHWGEWLVLVLGVGAVAWGFLSYGPSWLG